MYQHVLSLGSTTIVLRRNRSFVRSRAQSTNVFNLHSDGPLRIGVFINSVVVELVSDGTGLGDYVINYFL
jgi:hypothetical protein